MSERHQPDTNTLSSVPKQGLEPYKPREVMPQAGQRMGLGQTASPGALICHVLCRWTLHYTTLPLTLLSTRTWLCRTRSPCECPPIAPYSSAPSWGWHSQLSLPGCLLPRSSLESLLKINYNTMDGLIDRQSFHGLYIVQDGLPL